VESWTENGGDLKRKGAGMKVEKIGDGDEVGRNKIEIEKFFIDIREDIKV
jgi:hypothetical protein